MAKVRIAASRIPAALVLVPQDSRWVHHPRGDGGGDDQVPIVPDNNK